MKVPGRSTTTAEWVCRPLWQCNDKIPCQYQDRHMKNCHLFGFFYDNKFSNCPLWSIDALHNYKFMHLSSNWQWKLGNERIEISAVKIKRKMDTLTILETSRIIKRNKFQIIWDFLETWKSALKQHRCQLFTTKRRNHFF